MSLINLVTHPMKRHHGFRFVSLFVAIILHVHTFLEGVCSHAKAFYPSIGSLKNLTENCVCLFFLDQPPCFYLSIILRVLMWKIQMVAFAISRVAIVFVQFVIPHVLVILF